MRRTVFNIFLLAAGLAGLYVSSFTEQAPTSWLVGLLVVLVCGFTTVVGALPLLLVALGDRSFEWSNGPKELAGTVATCVSFWLVLAYRLPITSGEDFAIKVIAGVAAALLAGGLLAGALHRRDDISAAQRR